MGATASVPASPTLEVLTQVPDPQAAGPGEASAAAVATTTATGAAAAAEQQPSTSAPTEPPPPPPKPLPPGRRPYPAVSLPTPEQMAQEDMMNNCGVRTVLSGAMGAGLGVLFGLFMGTMDAAGGGLDGGAGAAAAAAAAAPGGKPPPPPPTQTARQVLVSMARSAGSRSVSYAKGFAAMGALFAGAECCVEKFRAKHDAMNAVYAGCAAGGALASPAGAKAAAVGCASFAAFSAFIERMMDH
jgi:mitochondrial import inner membrane translocase subunit TIM22